MAFIQIESENPNFSFLIHKNPASGMIVKQLRQGLLFGYYSQNNTKQFNCWFKDHDRQVSFDPDKEFEFNDVSRYSAASFVTNCFDEFFHEVIVKDLEGDKEGFQNSVFINCLRSRKKYFEIFNNTFRDFQIEYEPFSPHFFQVRIRTKKSLRKLFCFTSLIAIINSIQNGELKVVDDKLLIKYARFIQYLDAPYFVRYIFKINLARHKSTFYKVRDFLCNDVIKMKHGHNIEQRWQFIEQNLVGSTVIDVGCGEGKYFKFAEKVKQYYGIERDENSLERCRHRIQKLNAENIELFESLDELPEISGQKTLFLTEVIEHNTIEDAAVLLQRCLLPETRVLITTPNRDFNIYYSHDDENVEQGNVSELQEDAKLNETKNDFSAKNFRHEGHLFEFSDSEFRDFVMKLVEGKNAEVRFFNLGDEVHQVTPQSAAMIDIP